MTETLTAMDDVIRCAIAWRHADENDCVDEAERLTDAVDAFEAAYQRTGVKP